MFIEYVNYIAYKYLKALNTFLTLIDGGCDELNEHGGVLCTFWGKLSNNIYYLA
jgi:hypothetical protein